MNDMVLNISKMENKGDFKVYVEFNNGFSGTIDFKPALGTDYRELQPKRPNLCEFLQNSPLNNDELVIERDANI